MWESSLLRCLRGAVGVGEGALQCVPVVRVRPNSREKARGATCLHHFNHSRQGI